MIRNFIRYRKNVIFFYFLANLFFALVYLLYRLPFTPLAYSIFIFSFVFFLWMMIDYFKFIEKIKELDIIKKNLTEDRHTFPIAQNRIEEKYQSIMEALYEIIRKHEEDMEKTYIEQLEYYTLWVHQIKTPISAMQLALNSKEAFNKEALLEQELFKIQQYVELALQYTKIQELSNDLVIHEYALEDIIRQSVKKYASLFIYKKLSIEIQEFHKVVVTDGKWLPFIIEQLLSNAIKYTNTGGIQITFENDILRIKDTGIGIRSEDLARIFEKGYTGYNGRIDNKASGIGLYLVKKVAGALSVEVEITSKLGSGTTANICFLQNNQLYFE